MKLPTYAFARAELLRKLAEHGWDVHLKSSTGRPLVVPYAVASTGFRIDFKAQAVYDHHAELSMHIDIRQPGTYNKLMQRARGAWAREQQKRGDFVFTTLDGIPSARTVNAEVDEEERRRDRAALPSVHPSQETLYPVYPWQERTPVYHVEDLVSKARSTNQERKGNPMKSYRAPAKNWQKKITVLVSDGAGVWNEQIAPTLDAMQQLVGGYIQGIPLSQRKGRTLSLYVNEEGLYTQPLNVTLTRAFSHMVNGAIHGTGFIVAETNDGEDLASLTVSELKEWSDLLVRADVRPPTQSHSGPSLRSNPAPSYRVGEQIFYRNHPAVVVETGLKGPYGNDSIALRLVGQAGIIKTDPSLDPDVTRKLRGPTDPYQPSLAELLHPAKNRRKKNPSELESYYQSFSQGHWAHRDPRKCACRGSGYALSDVDTVHPCPHHHVAGQHHPEDDCPCGQTPCVYYSRQKLAQRLHAKKQAAPKRLPPPRDDDDGIPF